MATHRVLTEITVALFGVVLLGCAGPAATTGESLESAGRRSPALTAVLCGTWQGEFAYIGSDLQSSTGSSDLILEVNGDSTYTLRWGNNRPSTGDSYHSGEPPHPRRRVGITDHSRSFGRQTLRRDEGPGGRTADDDEPGKAGFSPQSVRRDQSPMLTSREATAYRDRGSAGMRSPT